MNSPCARPVAGASSLLIEALFFIMLLESRIVRVPGQALIASVTGAG